MTLRFERGTQYSVDVHVTKDKHVTFYNIKYPDNTTTDVIKQLLEDAHTAAIKKVEEYNEAASGQ